MRLPAAIAVGILLLSGCFAGPKPVHSAPAVLLGPMALSTVPLEPQESRGQIQVDWENGLFAVWTKGEGGMPAMAIRDGTSLYVTDGMAWTKWDLQAYADSTSRGFRYLAWDVQDLLRDASTTSTRPDGGFLAQSGFLWHGRQTAVSLAVDADAGHATRVVLNTSADPEAPFTLTPLATKFPFAVALPAGAKTRDEVATLDGQASQSHTSLLKLVDAYRTDHGGTLPDTLDPQTLRLELVASGASWPQNPYSGQPLQEEQASGGFHWVHCAAQDGHYEGNGWDGVLLRYSFGNGCP